MKTKVNNTFYIDEVNSDEEYLYVDMEGLCTVVIKREHEGVVVDIYPLTIADEPVASTYAFEWELWDNDEED